MIGIWLPIRTGSPAGSGGVSSCESIPGTPTETVRAIGVGGGVRRLAGVGVVVSVMLALAFALALALNSSAAAYTPTSDDEILERLPAGWNAEAARRQRQELAEDPENLRDSVELARSYLETASRDGDPRMVGFTREVLAPWWDSPSPPVPVLVVRARVRALGLEWDRALADLESVLAMEPTHAEAGVMRVEWLRLRGELDQARRALERLDGDVPRMRREILTAQLGRIGGDPAAVAGRLRAALKGADAIPLADHGDALVLLADLARQRGLEAEASGWLARARALGVRDVALEEAEAELWLDQGRLREVVDGRLASADAVDRLVIRRLAAWVAVEAGSADDAAARTVLLNQVTRRLEARRQRGDVSVLADEAWFRWRVTRESGLARDRARELWSVRRDPADLRLWISTARAAGDKEGERAATDWMRRHGYVDARVGAGVGVGAGATGGGNR